MKRSDLEHVIRAAAAITNEYELVVVGSQSILAAAPQATGTLVLSMEADIYPLNRPELADLIDGAIGEHSPFHDRFGYYAQGVGPETAVLPEGWRDRLIKLQGPGTDLKLGLCLEPHDLAASKLVAGREKDGPFVKALFEQRLIEASTLDERIGQLPIPPDRIDALKLMAGRLSAQASGREISFPGGAQDTAADGTPSEPEPAQSAPKPPGRGPERLVVLGGEAALQRQDGEGRWHEVARRPTGDIPAGNFSLDVREVLRGGEAVGPVLHVDERSVYQLANDRVVRHERATFEAVPTVGERIRIQQDGVRARVDAEPNPGRGRGRSR